MKIAFLLRLRLLLFVWPLLISSVILSQSTYAQGDPPRQRSLRQEPSNEFTGVKKKVRYIWGCYNSSGKWLDCTFEQSVEGLKQPENCPLDDDGGATLCNDGGHTHNGRRPLIFNEDKGGKLLYFADQLPGAARRVKGITNTPPTRWAVTVHELPQAGGRLFAKGQMQFFGGGFGRPRFDRNTKQSEMTVDVRILDLTQLRNPTPADFFVKARRGPFGGGTDSVHVDGVAYAGSPDTVALLPLIAENYFFLSLGKALSINDISLPKGGVFEASFLNPQWVSPHMEHRDGNDVDINRFDPFTGESLGTCKGDRALRLGADQLLFPTKRDDGTLSALLCETGERRHLDIKTTVVP